MAASAPGKIYWRRSEYLLHRVAYTVVSGLVAYGQSTEGVPTMACSGWRAPVWWRSYARAHLVELESFCLGVGDQHDQPRVEPPNPQ
jgi:hypothetical protein